MPECPFCEIAEDGFGRALAWADQDLIVFADHRPIRPGHVQIIPRAHVEVFDDLPDALLARMVTLGKQIAKAQKRLYGVTRVGFAFTGNEVAHVHAHVLPLHAADDITSARYGDGTAGYIDVGQMVKTARSLGEALRQGDLRS